MRNAALLTWLIVLLSGCGVMMMSSPKSDNPADPPRCSESRGGVVLDGLFASTYGVGSLMLVAAEGGDDAALLTGLLGAVHVASAVAGYRSASRCTKAHEAHQAWLDTNAPRPARLLDEDREAIMGVAGSACYANMTCNAGLRCDPDSKLCVVPDDADSKPVITATPPAEPTTNATAPATATTPATTTTPVITATTPATTTTPAASTTPGETAAKAPATTPAQPDPQTRSQPAARPTPPRRRPRAPRRAPASDEPWGDFWREVNP